MDLQELLQRSSRATDWWVVRGESGALWATLFHPRRVVALGTKVPRFSTHADIEERSRALLAVDSYTVKEVNDFILEMDVGHVVMTPDEGSRAAWIGIVTSDWFASSGDDHWMQRGCDWCSRSILLGPAAEAIPKGPMGTIFNVTRHAPAIYQAIRSMLG
jgi:predicted Mrr-cat superfamily restriction endonuclease